MGPVTYAGFHALFLLPLLFVLTIVDVWTTRQRQLVYPLPVAAIVVVALAYTTPWDNLLILHGVWEYGDGTVVTHIWAAPVEEYLFIVIQPLIATLWLSLCGRLFDPPEKTVSVTVYDRALGIVVPLAIGIGGLALLTIDATLYIGSILAWSAPVLALQWAVGWPYLWARRRLVAVAIAVPTLYLAVADRIAIENGIWTLSSQYTTGISVGGLPIEEGAFFLLTTSFVVQGLVLYPWVLDRIDVSRGRS